MPRNVSNSIRTQAALFFLVILAASSFLPFVRMQLPPFAPQTFSAAGMMTSCIHTIKTAISPDTNRPPLPDLQGGFWDLLKKLFLKDKSSVSNQWRGMAGLAAGVLVPVSILAAYAVLVCGFLAASFPQTRGRESFRLALGGLVCSAYAWAGMIYLEREAGRFFKESLAESARGVFGFVAQYFVPEIHIQPGPALYLLPVFAISVWVLARMKKQF